MIGRLWYPQLDAYDAIRRMSGLLALWSLKTAPSPERLYICDFYMANPPLLHRTHMARDTRLAFNALHIPRPEASFISYPSPSVLFQKMAEVQREAFRTLSGKGLIDLDSLAQGLVRSSAAGSDIFAQQFLPLLTKGETEVGVFLIDHFNHTHNE